MAKFKKLTLLFSVFTFVTCLVFFTTDETAFASSCFADCNPGSVLCMGPNCYAVDNWGCYSWDWTGQIIEQQSCAATGGTNPGDPPPGNFE